MIYAAGGNCHVYVDAAADLEKALRIVINAKCQRPGVCNAAETLLVHRDVAAVFLPAIVAELTRRGVELVVDKTTADIVDDPSLKRANKTHYETEFLSLKMAVRTVDSLDEAIEHITAYGTGHSEAIVTEDIAAARRFTQRVDAACVYVNASTRFTDGGQFGLGAEMGISTQKLHARGPIALEELTCTKYVRLGRRPGARAERGRWPSRRASGRARRQLQPAAPRPPHHRLRRSAPSSGSSTSLFMPAAAPPHKQIDDDVRPRRAWR